MNFDKDIYVVIPAYNESEKIGFVIDEVKQFCKNVVVVDDGSDDDILEVIDNKKAVVLKHIINLGKGAALKTGCDFAVRNGAKKIIVLDADGQHEPCEIPKFLRALEKTDVVFGCRELSRDMPFILRFGNWFISLTACILFGIRLKDTQCGYRAFSSSAYKKIRWKAVDYSMESEMISNIYKKKLRYACIPVKTIYADDYKGTTVIDGIKIVLKMITWRLFK